MLRCVSRIYSRGGRAPRLLPALAASLLLPILLAVPAAASARAHAAGTHGRRTTTSPRARDALATRRYIEADYALVRVARAHLAASEAGIRALVSRTVGECPLAGEGAYVNAAANDVSEEVIGTVVTTAYRPDVPAIDAFVARVRHLHWSDSRLTRIVHVYVARLKNLAALAPANLCEDVKAYAATSFLAAPEATLRFNKLYLAANIEAEEVPLRLLKPYESAHDATLLHRAKKLEAPLAEAEAKAVEEWMDIMRGLALSL
jgi:hypothetical protein